MKVFKKEDVKESIERSNMKQVNSILHAWDNTKKPLVSNEFTEKVMCLVVLQNRKALRMLRFVAVIILLFCIVNIQFLAFTQGHEEEVDTLELSNLFGEIFELTETSAEESLFYSKYE